MTCHSTGELMRMVLGGSQTGTFPDRLSPTGLFVDTATLIPNRGVLPYEINFPSWKDGARARRWVAPAGPMGFDPRDSWSLPVGSVVVKHFEVDDPSGNTWRLETRVMVHEQRGWGGYLYRWNRAQTDAVLQRDRRVETVTLPDGTPFRYLFPGASDCAQCHRPGSGEVLGLQTYQWNRPVRMGGQVVSQLDWFNARGWFAGRIAPSTRYPAMPTPGDRRAPIEHRARSWLHTNCAHCHRPSTSVPSAMDLRVYVPEGNMNVVDVRPTAGSLGIPDPYLVAPGDPRSSVLHARLRATGAHRMPPLGLLRTDPAGIALVGRWISGR